MGPCKGIENWLECLACPRICTSLCPIEGKNVIEQMKRQMHGLYSSGASEPKEPLRKLD